MYLLRALHTNMSYRCQKNQRRSTGSQRNSQTKQASHLIFGPFLCQRIWKFTGFIFNRAIKRLGFSGSIGDGILGAELVSAAVNEFLLHSPRSIYISSACPVVVEYIRKYAPDISLLSRRYFLLYLPCPIFKKTIRRRSQGYFCRPLYW